MDLTTLGLEILVAVIYFVNKVLLLFGKRSGWLWGSLAATLGIFYFVRIELLIFAVLQGGLVILMGYGALPSKWKKPAVESTIIFVIVSSLAALTFFVAIGDINVAQFIASVLIIWGTYSLSHGRVRTGWWLYLVAHILTVYICYEVQQYIVASFQALSVVVSIIAIARLKLRPALS